MTIEDFVFPCMSLAFSLHEAGKQDTSKKYITKMGNFFFETSATAIYEKL